MFEEGHGLKPMHRFSMGMGSWRCPEGEGFAWTTRLRRRPFEMPRAVGSNTLGDRQVAWIAADYKGRWGKVGVP